MLAALHSPSWAADPVWHSDVDAAWKEARKQERPLLVFLSTAGCRYCTLMQNGSFADPDVAGLIVHGFVIAAVDADDVAWLVKSQKIESYPTTLVIAPDAKVVDRINGYLKAADLAPRLAKTAAPQRISSRDGADKK
jgi:protein disulfide-isomerase